MAYFLDHIWKAVFGASVVTTVILLAVLLTGCSVGLTGGGEFAIGMRNDNFLFLRSSVDGDKEGKTAGAVMVLDDRILDKVLGDDDCPKYPDGGDGDDNGDDNGDDGDNGDNGDDDVADPISD